MNDARPQGGHVNTQTGCPPMITSPGENTDAIALEAMPKIHAAIQARQLMAAEIYTSMPFEVLHRALVLLRRRLRLERSEIPALAGFRVFLARIEAISA